MMNVGDNYAAAARTFVELVATVPAQALDQPGLGEWDVRALIGHTSRSLLTVLAYLDQPASSVEVESAAAYYARIRTAAIEPAAVVHRGRAAGVALGNDPWASVASLAAEVTDKLSGFDGDYVLHTIAGGMRLHDYLPTRTFELVVHTLDISRATTSPVSFDREVLAEVLELGASIAVLLNKAPELLLAITGRQTLPAGFSIV